MKNKEIKEFEKMWGHLKNTPMAQMNKSFFIHSLQNQKEEFKRIVKDQLGGMPIVEEKILKAIDEIK